MAAAKAKIFFGMKVTPAADQRSPEERQEDEEEGIENNPVTAMSAGIASDHYKEDMFPEIHTLADRNHGAIFCFLTIFLAVMLIVSSLYYASVIGDTVNLERNTKIYYSVNYPTYQQFTHNLSSTTPFVTKNTTAKYKYSELKYLYGFVAAWGVLSYAVAILLSPPEWLANSPAVAKAKDINKSAIFTSSFLTRSIVWPLGFTILYASYAQDDYLLSLALIAFSPIVALLVFVVNWIKFETVGNHSQVDANSPNFKMGAKAIFVLGTGTLYALVMMIVMHTTIFQANSEYGTTKKNVIEALWATLAVELFMCLFTVSTTLVLFFSFSTNMLGANTPRLAIKLIGWLNFLSHLPLVATINIIMFGSAIIFSKAAEY